MIQQDAIVYLSRLLNRTITPDAVVSLTSGQRARFLSWLEEHGAQPEQVRGIVAASFCMEALEGLVPGAAAIVSSPQASSVPAPAAARLGGIGIDIQRIAEILPFDSAFDFASSAELARIFSPREIAYACAKSSPVDTLAGLFAAKEALIKAGVSHTGRALSDLEILPNEHGVPVYPGFEISISHSGEYAIAVAARLVPAYVHAVPAVSTLVVQPQETVLSAATEAGPRGRSLAGYALAAGLMIISFIAGIVFTRLM